MGFTFKDREAKKRLINSWGILLNLKSYFVPQTIEEYKKTDFWSPKLKVYSHEYFLHEKSVNALKQFIQDIHSIDDIRNTVSSDTVYQSVIRELEFEVISKLESQSTRNFEEVLEAIFACIAEKRENFEFFFILEGLELKNIKEVDCGKIKIMQFDEEFRDYICFSEQKRDIDKHSSKYILKFIDENFLGQVVIKCLTFGDFKKAQEIARFKAREVINFFRYLICVLAYHRIYENLIKIDILSQVYIQNEEVLARNTKNDSIILFSSTGRSNLEKFPVDQDRLKNIKEKVFFEDIIEILNSEERTELENCIITAIYWTGEAQNEFDWDVAFLKYWTALENIFSFKGEIVTRALSKGISVLLAFSAYRFIEVDGVQHIQTRISKLYKLRSKIIHRGLRKSVSGIDLVEICKYTSWVILSLLDLRTIGYTKLEEIDDQITRLYNILNRKEREDIAVFADKIQQILEEVSKFYPTNTIAEKMKVAAKVIQRIEDESTLLKTLSSLKPGDIQVLAQFLNHPATTFMVVALEEWQKSSKSTTPK